MLIPQTTAERDALFNALFAGLKPADIKPTSIIATLAPFRRQIMAKRREGYSLRQIGDQLKQPPFSLKVSPATIQVIIGGSAAKRRAKIKKLAALRAANLTENRPALQPAAMSASAKSTPGNPSRP